MADREAMVLCRSRTHAGWRGIGKYPSLSCPGLTGAPSIPEASRFNRWCLWNTRSSS